MKKILMWYIFKCVFFLPAAPSAYVLFLYIRQCINYGGDLPVEDVALVVFFAPFAFFLGPIAHDDTDPERPWLAVLLTAAIMALCLERDDRRWNHRRSESRGKTRSQSVMRFNRNASRSRTYNIPS
jgi:hypothetical protein